MNNWLEYLSTTNVNKDMNGIGEVGFAWLTETFNFWAIKHGHTLHHVRGSGDLVGITREDLGILLEEKKLKCLYKSTSPNRKYRTVSGAGIGQPKPKELYANSDTIISIINERDYELDDLNGHLTTAIDVMTVNPDFAEEYKELIKKYIKPPESKGHIFTLVSDESGLRLDAIGVAATELEPDNYNEKVIKDVTHIIEDLDKDKPCGTLSILYGEPGTGKTYLLRAMLGLAKEVIFVIIKPDMIDKLTSPEAIGLFIDRKKQGNNKRLVLVMEDADEVLAVRGADNMRSLSAVLNMSDGILGSMLDFRIIATTNAKKVELDPAVKRAGRLCKHVHVDKLLLDQAQKIAKRLCANNKIIPTSEANRAIGFDLHKTERDLYTLAEIYKAVYSHKEKLEELKTKE